MNTLELLAVSEGEQRVHAKIKTNSLRQTRLMAESISSWRAAEIQYSYIECTHVLHILGVHLLEVCVS